MAPLALFAAVSGELVVTAYQFGSGLVALVTPTSAVVMGGLAIARVGYGTWLKFVWPLLAVLTVMCAVLLALGAAAANLQPFYEVQRSSTAVGLVAERVAAAVVPRLALQKGAYPSLKTIELVEPRVSRTLVLMTRRTARLSPAAQALYDLIAAQASRGGKGARQR
jgi:DNA-binding transcriptional LysR family regulator